MQQNSFDQAEGSHRLAHHASMTEQGMTMPSPDEGFVPVNSSLPRWPTNSPVVAPIGMSSIVDAHIQKPMEQKQVVMHTLAENSVHHPLVWQKFLGCFVDKGRLFHDMRDIFTIGMCLNLVTSIYLPHNSPPDSYGFTLASASVTYYKQKLLTDLLMFFSTSKSDNDAVDPERRLSLAIVHALVPNAAWSVFNLHQRYLLDCDSTISKYRLLRIALNAINKAINNHAIDNSSKQWHTDTFWVIHS